MLFLIVNFVGLFQGRPVETQNFASLPRQPRAVSAVLSFPLIINILRRVRDKQTRERELPRDTVTENHLGRNVQKHAVVVLVRVA